MSRVGSKGVIFISVLSLGFSPGLAGNVHAQTEPETVGPASLTAQVDKIFAPWDTSDSPGCALAVIQKGRILYKRGYGMANLDHDVPITPSTRFHVASMSKQFTAAAIVLLTQQGKLSLDDPIRKYIPELPDWAAPITLRHLIHHTSGLRDQWGLLELAGWRYSHDWITNNDVLEMTLRQKELNFPPGERYAYSNTNYTLLAVVVERVSGQSLRQFTRAHMFDPLGMKDTLFRDDFSEIVKNQAYSYDRGEDGAWHLSITNFDTVGATSLLTTVEDLARWEQNFYELRVGGPALLEQFLERATLNSGERAGYSFSFGLSLRAYRGLPIQATGGGDAAYRAYWVRFPDQRFSVACLCNAGPANVSALAHHVADLYLAKEFKDPTGSAATAAVQLSQEQLASKTGLFWNHHKDEFRMISLKQGRLHLVVLGRGRRSLEMEPLSENHFRLVQLPSNDFRFEPRSPAGPLRLIQSIEGRPPEIFEPVDPISPTPAELQEYAGAYLCEEIDATYQITLEDGKLVLKRLKFAPADLAPVFPDLFRGPADGIEFVLRFARDPLQRIAALFFQAGGVKNLHCAKLPH